MSPAQASAALHGDRTFARMLAAGAPGARAALGLDPGETRPVIALVADPEQARLAPLETPRGRKTLARETEEFIEEVEGARDEGERAEIGRRWLEHGTIRPMIIGPDPLEDATEQWTRRPDASEDARATLCPHRSVRDIVATTRGETEKLATLPGATLAREGGSVYATHAGSAVRISHRSAGEALDALERGAELAPEALEARALVARLGETGVVVARHAMDEASARRWTGLGVTPARAEDVTAGTEASVIGLTNDHREAARAMRAALGAFGIGTRARASDASLTVIITGTQEGDAKALDGLERALGAPEQRWVLCAAGHGALAVTTGAGRSPRPAAGAPERLKAMLAGDDEAEDGNGSGLSDPFEGAAAIVARALGADRWSGEARVLRRAGERRRRPREAGSSRYRLVRSATWPHEWTERLRSALGANGWTQAPEGLPILCARTPAGGDLEALTEAAGTGAGGWAIVSARWMGWSVIARGNGDAAGPCPMCAHLRIENGPWARGLAAQIRGAGPGAGGLEACARHIDEAAARDGAAARLAWLDGDGHALAGSETIARQHRCANPGHERAGRDVKGPGRAPRHGPWTGSFSHSAPERAGAFEREGWAAAHRTRSPHPRRTRTNVLAGAVDESAAGAKRRAEFEAAERHAIEWHRGERRGETASVEELEGAGQRYIHPEELARFSRRQRAGRAGINAAGHARVRIPPEFEDGDRRRPLRWRIGTDMLDEGRGAVYVPEEWTLLNAPPARPERPGDGLEKRHCTADSNGCAAGRTLEEAIGRAYTELVERDALALWWYSRCTLPRIDLTALGDPWLARAPGHYENIARKLTVLDATTTSALPVTIAVSRRSTPLDDGSWDPAVSAGCGPTLKSAARHAIFEHIQIAPRRHLANRSWYEGARAPEQRAVRFWGPESHPWLEGASPIEQPHAEPRPGENPVGALERARRAARALETSLVAIDLTLSDTDPAVARVAAPELCHHWHRLGHERLGDGARRAGWTEETFDEDGLNPVPLVM